MRIRCSVLSAQGLVFEVKGVGGRLPDLKLRVFGVGASVVRFRV